MCFVIWPRPRLSDPQSWLGEGQEGKLGPGYRPVTGTDTEGHRLQDRTSNPALSMLLLVALSSYLPQLTRAC